MSKPAIVVENLSKNYRLGLRERQHQSFREAITGTLTAPFRRLREMGEQGTAEDTFWALKDVNFEVQPGEVVGIIGRNGAGKSTLLKVLSRIVEPTSGRIRLRGRVASLLEVGTGFHPELSGRENIYMNGSILGMRKAEIDRKFDEIVAFAEVEKFLDTPVKRYSSGMYVRLAFAVAAHLEPEILIVDEVLAVGDAEFQKKCLGKMQEVAAGGGRTVLFVSHNMAAVRSLCTQGIVLGKGTVKYCGDATTAISRYQEQNRTDAGAAREFQRPGGAIDLWISSAAILANGVPSEVLPMGGKLAVRVRFRSLTPIRHPRVGFLITNAQGERLLNTNNRFQPSPQFDYPVTEGEVMCDFGQVPFVAGKYSVSLYLGDIGSDQHVVLDGLTFEVEERDLWGTGKFPPAAASAMWWPTVYKFNHMHDHNVPGNHTTTVEAAQ